VFIILNNTVSQFYNQWSITYHYP